MRIAQQVPPTYQRQLAPVHAEILQQAPGVVHELAAHPALAPAELQQMLKSTSSFLSTTFPDPKADATEALVVGLHLEGRDPRAQLWKNLLEKAAGEVLGEPETSPGIVIATTREAIPLLDRLLDASSTRKDQQYAVVNLIGTGAKAVAATTHSRVAHAAALLIWIGGQAFIAYDALHQTPR
jgi:hypothetical protein